MNQIINWNPFAELETVHRGLSTLLDGRTDNQPVADWAPVVDIIEDDKAFFIKAELPEMKKEDVHVQLENGVLTISGERRAEREDKAKRYHRIERAYGAFARRFELPDNIDAGQVSATYKDGILTVSVAKAPEARPRQIEVKVN